MERILVIGANGQIGSELVDALAQRHGADNVMAADIGPRSLHGAACYETLDVLDAGRVAQLVDAHGATQVYQLAAMLSAVAEREPLKAWTLNMQGLLNVLEAARERLGQGRPLRVFWPSSIAAFGPHSPALDAPQQVPMDPATIYGISKLAGERMCEYYFMRYGIDVRSVRYPGIISHKTPPGGGTTDYAIAMLRAAGHGEPYVCYLGPDTALPMLYMPDAIRAALELMETPASCIGIHSAYNLAGLSFSPSELAQAISRQAPGFDVSYQPDQRQAIAATWPRSVDDAHARADWGWRARIGLEQLVADMLAHIGAEAGKSAPR